MHFPSLNSPASFLSSPSKPVELREQKPFFGSHQGQVGSHRVARYITTTSVNNQNHLPTALTLEALDLAASVATPPDVPRSSLNLGYRFQTEPYSDLLGERSFGFCHSDSASLVPSPAPSHLHLSFLAF